MDSKTMWRTAIGALALAILTACGAAEPFVFKEGEFDRDSLYFNREPEDIGEVMICYRRSATTPQAVASLANQRCGDFGKVARPRGHTFLDCPLFIHRPARCSIVSRRGRHDPRRRRSGG